LAVVQLPDASLTRQHPIPLRWEASDPDGEELRYNLAFSRDGGHTYQTFDIGLVQQAYDWDPIAFPGGASIFLRVTASDGFHTASDTWGPLSLPDAAPQVTIFHPEEGAVIGSRDQLALNALAVDLEDGLLDGSQVRWQDQTGRTLGEGARLIVEGLPVGEHRLLVTATDGGGQSAEAELSLTVFERPDVDPLAVFPLEATLEILGRGRDNPFCSGDKVDMALRVASTVLRPGTLVLAAFPLESAAAALPMLLEPDDAGEGLFQAQLTLPENAEAGAWQVMAMALDAGGQEMRSEGSSFLVGDCAAGTGALPALSFATLLIAAGLLILAGSLVGIVLLYRRRVV
jgi:hypothetical protein